MFRVWFRVPGIFWHTWYFVYAGNLEGCQRVMKELQKSDIVNGCDSAAIWECETFAPKWVLSERQLKKIGKIHTQAFFHVKS